MQGQANHFTRYAPEHIEYGVKRYQNEARRLYGVLNEQLEKSTSGYLVGDKCTIADIAHWGWIVSSYSTRPLLNTDSFKASAFWAGVDITEFPALQAWEDRMAARPALRKGKDVPTPHRIKELQGDKESTEKHAAEARKWVQGTDRKSTTVL
jgi:glutathione S-transferase